MSDDKSSRTRGRPKTFDRALALSAATELFWRHGYDGTSINDLTGAIGCTPPTLYALFGSKQSLYREVLQEYERRGDATRAPKLAASKTVYQAIETVLRLSAEHFSQPGKPLGCLLTTASQYCAAENIDIERMLTEKRKESLNALAHMMRHARDSGELPQDAAPEALARFYLAIVQGMSVQAKDGAGREELDAIVSTALQAWPGSRE